MPPGAFTGLVNHPGPRCPLACATGVHRSRSPPAAGLFQVYGLSPPRSFLHGSPPPAAGSSAAAIGADEALPRAAGPPPPAHRQGMGDKLTLARASVAVFDQGALPALDATRSIYGPGQPPKRRPGPRCPPACSTGASVAQPPAAAMLQIYWLSPRPSSMAPPPPPAHRQRRLAQTSASGGVCAGVALRVAQRCWVQRAECRAECCTVGCVAGCGTHQARGGVPQSGDLKYCDQNDGRACSDDGRAGLRAVRNGRGRDAPR